MKTEFDVIVVGMGVGGEEVAGRTADAGLEVLAVERRLIGGECPYWACIPSKMMLRAAGSLAEARRVDRLAGSVTVAPDWAPVAARIREEATDDWDDKVAVERHTKKGSVVLKSEARLVGPSTVEVDGTRYTARRGIVIATGSDPAIPPIEGLNEVPYWTNRDAIETESVPSSLVVVGGGAVGCELAQVFARFGSEVHIVEMSDHLLPPEEAEAGEALADALRDEGIEVSVGVTAQAARRNDEGIEFELDDGARVSGEKALIATGRRTDLASLGVDAVGLDPEADSIEVDGHLRAGDGLWAVGDVTGKGAFTHVAVYQGRIAAADILAHEHEPADYRALPHVTFTDPEVASVGMTEAQASDAGLDVVVGRSKTGSSARGWIHGPGAEHGITKLVADAKRRVLVGATTIGPAAGEVLGLLALAVKEATPLDSLRTLIYPYPTFVRGVEDALRDIDE